MSRNKFYRLWILWCLLSLMMGSAHAAKRNLVLLMGDVESRPAMLAVRTLQSQLQASDIGIRIVLANNVTAADRSALRDADAALLNVQGRQLVQSVQTELETLAQRKRPVLGVGGGVDESLRNLGVQEDRVLQDYYRAGGVDNMTNLLRYLLYTRFGIAMEIAPVRSMPDVGIYNVSKDRTVKSFDEFRRDYAQYRPGAPWIGVVFYRASLVAGQTLPLASIVHRLEQAGYNVLPVFGYPYEVPLGYLLDEKNKPRVDMIVALGMKVGGTGATGEMLEKIGVPAINAITLSQQTVAQWKASKVGLDIIERTWQLAGAERSGLIQPTVVASRERARDSQTGIAYVEEQPIAERIERLTDRINAWLLLRHTANAEKHIALLYYNYPHGSETIGAAYLNVLPESLWQITQRLSADGYRTSDSSTRLPDSKEALQTEIQRWGKHPGKSSKEYNAGLAQLAASGEALLVPLTDYRRWYAQLPATLRNSIEKAWGPPERAPTMWRNAQGEAQFVFPARRYGNVLLAPQPTRAWEQNLEKLHNDVTLPPSHEYLAFYLWLQNGYKANAVIHLGTHGTQEWLTGKEAGLSDDDSTEALIGAMPNIYPYVMDDVGEGLQAKRRGMATIIDHMTPPFDAAGLNPDLRELGALLNDYRVAEQKSPLLARSHLLALNRLAKKSGAIKDMGLKTLASEADLEALEEYLDTVATKLTPFGLHTFGVAPSPAMRRATAQAVLSLDASLKPEERETRTQKMADDMDQSATLELARLMQALEGRYIPAGPSADLVRNPAALPTGRNFFGLDPSRIPSRTTYEQGARLAQQLVDDYRKRHGTYPDKMTVNLWGVETSRHEGIMEAEVLSLLGIRPTWDDRGRVTGVEAISRRELGRPRVDVTMVSSGLFRDLFANLLMLLDDAARLAQQQDDSDNPLPLHTRKLAAYLEKRGVPAEEAKGLAGTRIFGLPSGAYGTNIEKLLPLSNAWQNEQQVADVFINRMSFPFSQGNWGEGSESTKDNADLRREMFKQALSGSKIALHSRSSNLFATLDNDDFFQYLGGTALAIRSVDGKTPEVMVADLANPRRPKHDTLQSYMGKELQSRYLNPKWADNMLKEGYAGARFINRTVEYLWAWQVTVPEVVDENKWQQMYDTYVADRHHLNVRERFAKSGNLLAFQSMTDRMLTAVEKGYWHPPATVKERLLRENGQTIAEAGAACGMDSCSGATMQQLRQEIASGVPVVPNAAPLSQTNAVIGSAATATATAAASPISSATGEAPATSKPATPKVQPAKQPVEQAAPSAKENSKPQTTEVSGLEMESLSGMTSNQKTIGTLALLALAAILVGVGYWRRSTR